MWTNRSGEIIIQQECGVWGNRGFPAKVRAEQSLLAGSPSGGKGRKVLQAEKLQVKQVVFVCHGGWLRVGKERMRLKLGRPGVPS